MKLTDIYKLPYPDPDGNDFGNGSLELKMLADAVDLQFSTLITSLTNAQYTPAFIATMSSSQTVAAGSEVVPFSQTGSAAINLALNLTYTYQRGSLRPDNITEAGSYMFGCMSNMTPTGTVTANSLRQFTLCASMPNGAQFTNQRQYIYRATTLEPNIGSSTALQAMGVFDYVPIDGNPPLGLWWGWNHGNTGSTVTASGGTMWCIKFSDIAS